jgi:hypothetical protein
MNVGSLFEAYPQAAELVEPCEFRSTTHRHLPRPLP